MSKFNVNPMCSKSLNMRNINPTSSHGQFTKHEWNLNNDIKYRNAEDQQKIAERVIGKCERIREETEERTITNKETTDRRFIERIDDIQFSTQQLQIQRKETCLELEAMGVYKVRLIDCLHFIHDNCFKQCGQCIMLRKGRIGIDLVVDEVEIALHKEMTSILHWKNCLEKALDQSEESMRRVRAARYALDLDLEHKEQSKMLENVGANLKPTDLLIISNVVSVVDPANVTKTEWEVFSIKNIANAVKEVSLSRPIRIMIDTYLQQVVEELESAYISSNRAFKIRIIETKKAKFKLEEILAETICKAEALMDTMNSLEQSLHDKQAYVTLVNTRFEKRALRPGVELVKDAVCQSLSTESEMLKVSVEQLLRALEEAQTSLRYLFQTQMQLEEEIDIKTNSIKIDEVECMTIRDTMNYHPF